MLDVIEITSDTTLDSGKTFDYQETISEDKLNEVFLANSKPQNIVNAEPKKHPAIVQEKEKNF